MSGINEMNAVLRTSGSDQGAVEKNGHLVVINQPASQFITQRHCVGGRSCVEGHEGHDINDAKTRVHALVSTEIQAFVTGRDEGVHAVDEGDGLINQREDGAIMELVTVHVL
jgi:hypothetical protein